MTAWLSAFTLSVGLGSAGTVDQSNTGFSPPLFQSIRSFSPIGQSFTPTKPQLTFVDLFTQDLFTANQAGGTVSVQIRSGSIFGSILGTSSSVILPGGFSGPTTFRFPSLVILTGESPFVIEVLLQSGDDWAVGSSGGPISTYARGDEILLGAAQHSNDLWFDEGYEVPEPPAYLLLFLGCSAFGVQLWNRRVA